LGETVWQFTMTDSNENVYVVNGKLGRDRTLAALPSNNKLKAESSAAKGRLPFL
jgi:hypothetical protein